MPDPEQTDDAVRRLLADARHDEPLPPEVAERLDVLLGRLVEQRAAQAPVDELAVRRDRRRRLLLVAAAVAVVVVGTGGVISRLDPRSGSDQASDSSAGSAAESDAGSSTLQAPADVPPSELSAGESTGESTGEGTERDQPEAAAPAQARRSLPLTDAGFEVEVRDALADPSTTEAYESSLTLLLDSCALPADAPTGPGTTSLPATYDGRDAVLVTAAPVAGRRQVALYLCGDPTPARTTEVDAPR